MEYIDVCDENGIPTGEKENIVQLHKDGKWHKVVGIIIYDKNNKILMQQRALNEKSDAGKWDIAAAGHVDSDETEIQAILRETKEEIGIELSLEQLELFMTYKKEVKNDKVNKKHLEYIYIAKIENIVEQNLKIQKEEVEQVKLLTIDEVEKLVNEGKVKTRDNMYEKLFELLNRNKKI